MEEWKECKLGDICNISSSKRIFAEEYVSSGIPFYRGKEIIEKHNKNTVSSELFITHERFAEIKSKFPVPQIDDILLTSVGTLGIPWLVNESNFYFKDGNLTWFRSNTEKVNPKFLYYWFESNYAKNQIDSMCIGSTQKALTIDTLSKFSIKLPPLPTQQKIAAILSSLDDKIELNNKINTNLEQQAQALFKNWFVDFEPFGGKMPEGWKEAEFRDVCENITDGVHNTVVDDPNGEFLLLSCKNIKGGVLTISSSERKINKETFEKLRKRTKLAKGDILLSSVGTVGEMYLLNETPDNYEFQRSVAIIKPNTSLISPAFLYESMLSQKDTIIHSAHGAVQQCIFISDVGDFTTILPTLDVIEKFTNIVQPMLDTITANQHENQKLSNMRDTLLPKLMNGEIEVGIK